MEKGTLEWIGIRPERKEAVIPMGEVRAVAESGLAGDHYQKPGGSRQVTLIMAEDLAFAAAQLEVTAISPDLTRRNLVTKGIDLHQANGRSLRIGECIIEISGPCRPCSRMDENLGPGGLKALAGRGGFTAYIRKGGLLRTGDDITWQPKGKTTFDSTTQ